MRLRQLERGQEFELAGREWLVLEHDEDECQTLVIAKECFGHMAFGENFNNDFVVSTLREFLNYSFLGKLIDAGLKPGDLISTDCRDIVGLLTEEQYEKHRDILMKDTDKL